MIEKLSLVDYFQMPTNAEQDIRALLIDVKHKQDEIIDHLNSSCLCEHTWELIGNYGKGEVYKCYGCNRTKYSNPDKQEPKECKHEWQTNYTADGSVFNSCKKCGFILAHQEPKECEHLYSYNQGIYTCKNCGKIVKDAAPDVEELAEMLNERLLPDPGSKWKWAKELAQAILDKYDMRKK